jgi:HSP20 family protein
MERYEQKASPNLDHIAVEMFGLLGDPMSGQHWLSPRQRKIWRPPTDVYETDDCMVVKVEIAGIEEKDLSVSLEGRRLIISGVRHDPADKLGYQQMEIQYGQFETDVHIPRAVEEANIEATYQGGFLIVRLPKSQPRRVPVISAENSS